MLLISRIINTTFIRWMALSFIPVFIFLLHIPSSTGNNPVNLDDLKAYLSRTPSDSLKIAELMTVSNYFSDVYNDKILSDSLGDVAISIARKSNNAELLILTLCRYVEITDLTLFRNKAVTYANEAAQLSMTVKNWYYKWMSQHSLCAVYLEVSLADYNKALDASQKSLVIAFHMKRKDLIAESCLDVGKSLEGLNLKIEALKNYLHAVDITENIHDTKILGKCFSVISLFYRFNNLMDKAWDYKMKQFALFKSVQPVDSTAFMWLMHDTISLSLLMSKNKDMNESRFASILQFSYRNNNNRLRQYLFALYRSYLIDAGKIDVLKKLYTDGYPKEFEKLLKENPGIYYRLRAFFCESERKNDSALYYFRKAEAFVKTSKNLFVQANFYYRFGQLYKRTGDDKNAIEILKYAYDLATKASVSYNAPYLVNIIKTLEDLYIKKSDYHNAYLNALAYNHLIENMQSIEKKEQVIFMDLTVTQQKHDLENLKEKQSVERLFRKRNNERNLLAVVMFFLMILTVTFYLYYRNQKKSNLLLDAAKKKSDDLLLNILPAETAEELKHTGAAKAKKISEATVMFTDFKDFTKVSEKMEAEELVRKIHFYFSEFDRIISKYDLEKIKIIGDSYMCAGGIPVSSKNHAIDMVNAALDMQAFVKWKRDESILKNEIYFELRIGIHSGPVVAGIVGLKKFAYDIWGDTVNTASRMESSGEVNMVNISGTTYELVKNHFVCRYRGKVPAKNKGEVDMYFVEGRIESPVYFNKTEFS